MIICALCNAENIEGIDVCKKCGQPFSDTHLPKPATEVERSLVRDRISALSPREPIVVSPDTQVQEVLNLLVEKAIGCVLVVDDGMLVGVFSERDALMRLNTEVDEFADRPISEVMTTNPKQLQSHTKVAFAVRLMDQGGVRHVPVMGSEGNVEGIVSVRDILRYLTEKMTA